MKIEMRGYAHVRADAKTVEDLHQLLRFLDDNLVSRDANVDWGSGYVYVGVVDDASAEFIQCGNHRPTNMKYDVILDTHYCGPESYEEARDERQVAMFDWPTKDRLKNET